MESALMVDRRVGSLPAPLATVVFHYDQENGSRPCEAAYLSELKEGGMQGVKDVVVLVSPNNWEQRRGVYAHLEHVRVEPLRIAESDLNAPRMLSMMGVDGSEVIPLYLHRALSILRDTPSDTFTYKGFRHQLEREAFNTTQSNMLQIRLELLESFLRGIGPDISSFLRPGKLVIIDLSDPFVDGTTAAMLFDICLGLFIGRDGLKGKLIGKTPHYRPPQG
ncbi:hypothetical protein FRC17_008216 [Serendipita sp. 399]|nr:hypothetical protein FRC17_008216 [Serendipita sp. 399]